MPDRNRAAVDHTALWSAALAAVLTLSLGDGRYDWLSFALGTALGLEMAAFYRPAFPEPDARWDRTTAAGVFGAVGGLVTTMVLAWPVQALVGTPASCRRLFERDGADLDDCAGTVAYHRLGVVWAAAAVVLAYAHWAYVVRPPSAAPHPADGEPAPAAVDVPARE
ncbi:hypothetical protein [Streptomyces sp.]|uniref:hypothetical protein n=1 Tax=Streptomyces sp. TaxID=1931 RepID=UPI002F3F8E1A